MANKELSSKEREALLYLSKRHKNGELSVDADEVLRELKLNEVQLEALKRSFFSSGLLDKIEDESSLSLSGAALRLVPHLISEKCTEETLQTESRSPAGSFLSHFASAWEAQVMRSELSDSEKKSLVKIGRQFFLHPATPEILRRLLSH